MTSIEKFGPTIRNLETFVMQLDPSIREEAFRFLLAQEFTVTAAACDNSISSTTPRTRAPDRDLSVQELLRKSNPESMTTKAIVLGYWLENHANKSTFSSGDLKQAFEDAREPVPKNVSDVVAKLEYAGKLMKAEKSGGSQTYRLTNTAITDVEQLLHGKESTQ